MPLPGRLAFAAESEPLVVLTFEVSLGEWHGTLNLCYPRQTLEPVATRLAEQLMPVSPKTGSGRGATPGRSAAARDGMVEMVVHLASTRLAAGEMAGLAVGDVIVTECHHDQPLIVRVDGTPRFTGSAGLVDGRKAVRIGAALPADAHARKSHPAAEEAESAAPD
jgi:flagellar motor switch protein FliM